MNKKKEGLANIALDRTQADVLLALARAPFTTQRALAESVNASLGKVHEALHTLIAADYLTADMRLTSASDALFAQCRPQRAVVLAAGSGIRMAPLSDLPKALLEVRGERLIDRLITQLHEAGITDITVVTGFMKERCEYLIDRFGVQLLYNGEYIRKNNLHTLALAADRLTNCYIIPSDLWFAENPFSERELYPWYLLQKDRSEDGEALLTRKLTVTAAGDGEAGYGMIGLAYLTGEAAAQAAGELCARDKHRRYQRAFWESILLEPPCVTVYGRLAKLGAVYEINTFEELRALDYNADQLSCAALDVIDEALHVQHDDIRDVTIMKKGMTNRSFLFTVGRRRYIMRIPGEGSGVMINRRQEYDVYETLRSMQLSDTVVYISPETGYKITEFWEGARVCDAKNEGDVRVCMRVLRAFHDLRLTVPHTFDLFERIDFYESLLHGEPSVFTDYGETKRQVLSLKPFIDARAGAYSLTHIDAVADNFLFVPGGVRLIDWEYAGMQDPHVDIAMFAVYAMYDRAHVEALIDSYFTEGCEAAVRAKIYCYIAVCGLLWSNWCEYKRALGVEFGAYALSQYRYAKEYCPIARAAIGEIEDAAPCR